MPGTLYMVATPIGNVRDISDRAKSTLRDVDFVFAEDTRVTRKLLTLLEIENQIERYDHHSHGKNVSKILGLLEEGKSIAFVSDAGTPGVEDPGGLLVEAVVQALPEVAISPIPGPSALMAALSVSGFKADKFCVLGFPPNKKGRMTYFDRLADTTGTVVVYESTHRILKSLSEIAERQPARRLVVARELTKKFETLYRGTAEEVMVQLKDSSTKGEFMIVLE